MNEKQIREYLLHLIDQGKSSGTVNINNSALRFIFGAVLERNSSGLRVSEIVKLRTQDIDSKKCGYLSIKEKAKN